MNNPLVSVVVLSYNSELTILDTLESIKNQDYDNLEVIICDDFSTDSTQVIINRWVDKNKSDFINIWINLNNINQGISKNMKIAISFCKGEWIKVIAADDILESTCISANINYINLEKNANFVFSNIKNFNNEYEWNKFNRYRQNKLNKWNKLSIKKQYKKILKSDLGCTPSFFFNKQAYASLHDNIIICKNIEDWPLHIIILKNGWKLYYFNEYTVKYRIHNSISEIDKRNFYNLNMVNGNYKIKKELCYPEIKYYNIIYWWNEFFLQINQLIIIKIFKNKKNKISVFVNFIIQMFYFDGIKRNMKELFKFLMVR